MVQFSSNIINKGRIWGLFYKFSLLLIGNWKSWKYQRFPISYDFSFHEIERIINLEIHSYGQPSSFTAPFRLLSTWNWYFRKDLQSTGLLECFEITLIQVLCIYFQYTDHRTPKTVDQSHKPLKDCWNGHYRQDTPTSQDAYCQKTA